MVSSLRFKKGGPGVFWKGLRLDIKGCGCSGIDASGSLGLGP